MRRFSLDPPWHIDLLVPLAVAVLGGLLIHTWLATGAPYRFERRVPGLDRDAADLTAGADAVAPPVAGAPIAGPGEASTYPGTWPCFRGAQRDGIAHEAGRLARAWPETGPPQLWTRTLGEGYASPAIADGCVYVLDYDEEAKADTMLCLSLDDGREIWRNSYPVEITRNHGLSRTVPAIVDDCVISFGPRCHVACWDANSGECRWLIDLVQQFGAIVPRWYAGQCPLIDNGLLILAPCGDSLIIAVDYTTGEVVWQTPNTFGWEMTHASITPMTFHQRMYVYCASGGVFGVSADDGKLLWSCDKWTTQFATAPSALELPEGQVLVSSGYRSEVGALLLQLTYQDGEFSVEPPVELTPREFNSEQQTPIFYDGYVYGIRKHGGGKIVCLDTAGQEQWNSGRDRLGHGPYLIADGLLFALSNDGLLVMCEATPDAYKRLDDFQVFEDGHDAWGPMALVGGRLIVRDMTRMTCLDISAPVEGNATPGTSTSE